MAADELTADAPDMLELKLSVSLARKLRQAARSSGRTPNALAREAIERELDRQRWWECQIEAGIRDADEGGTIPASEVIAKGEAILARHARKTRKTR